MTKRHIYISLFISVFFFNFINAHAQLINTVAGNGTSGYSGDGGAASAAEIAQPHGLAIDTSGNIYIADGANNRVRKTSATGIITTVAGTGSSGYSGDGGDATAAALSGPTGVAVSSDGTVYIADNGNNRIRKVSPTGTIATLAGNGTSGYTGDGSPATAAAISRPYAIALDTNNNVYFTDLGNNVVRKITTSGTITTVAGNGSGGYAGDGGAATNAELNTPYGLTIDRSGNLYIADAGNSRIRKVSLAGTITTFAGTLTSGYTGDGGAATLAKLHYPIDVATDATGNIYIADELNYRIRKVATGGTITTIGGNGSSTYSGDGGPATVAGISLPQGLALNSRGDIYITDNNASRIRKINCSTPVVPAITGSLTVCSGAATTLSGAVAGGEWSVSNATLATVSTSGVVSGISAGNDTVYYVVSNACGTTTISRGIAIAALPAAGTIGGTPTVCQGDTVALTETTLGGTWALAGFAGAVAAIDTGGRLRGISPGTVTVEYLAENSCGVDTAFFTATVNPRPQAGLLGGTNQLCIGGTGSVSSTDSGGVWSTAEGAILHLNATTGGFSALSAGTAIITYTTTNSCGSAMAYDTVRVLPFPVLNSTLTPAAVCSGAPFAYSATTITTGAAISWTREVVTGISNIATSDTGNAINETLTNTTSAVIPVSYFVTIRASGCANTENVTVDVNPTPTLSGGLNFTTCSGARFVYNASSPVSGTSFSWTRAALPGITPAGASGPASIAETLNNSTSAAIVVGYQFHLTANGCTNSENINVSVESAPPPPPHITLTSPSWVCSNTLYQNFGAATTPPAGVTYTWGANSADIWATGSTKQYALVNFNYTGVALVTLTASYTGSTCGSRDSFVVAVGDAVSEYPAVTFANGTFTAPGDMFSYQWGYDDVTTLAPTTLAGETSASYANATPDFTHNLYWVITEHQWCTQKSYYQAPLSVVGVSEMNNVVITPNPNNGNFTIKAECGYDEKGTVIVANIMGQVMKIAPFATNSVIEVSSDIAPGIYFVTINTAHIKYTGRITVTK